MNLNIPTLSSTCRLIIVSLFFVHVTGCAVLAIADAAVTAVATTVKTTVKAVGAIADTVIPDSKEKEGAAAEK